MESVSIKPQTKLPGVLEVVTRTVIIHVPGEGVDLAATLLKVEAVDYAQLYIKPSTAVKTKQQPTTTKGFLQAADKRPVKKKPFKNHLAVLLSVDTQPRPVNCKIFETNRVQITGVKSEEGIPMIKERLAALLGKDVPCSESWSHNIPLTNAFFFLPSAFNPTEKGIVPMTEFADYLQRQKTLFGTEAVVTLDPMLIKSIKIVIPSRVTILVNSTGNVWLLGASDISSINLSKQLITSLYNTFMVQVVPTPAFM